MAKNVYAARVLNVGEYQNRVSFLLRVVSESGKPVESKTVDIRVPKEAYYGTGHDLPHAERVAKGLLGYKEMGLQKGAQVTFNADGIMKWQAERPGGGQGDRMLPARKDRITKEPIPGTETKVHRIANLDVSTLVIQLRADLEELEPETNETLIAQNKTLCETAAALAAREIAGPVEEVELAV